MSAEHGGGGHGGERSRVVKQMEDSAETFTDPIQDCIGLFILGGLMLLGVDNRQSGRASGAHH